MTLQLRLFDLPVATSALLERIEERGLELGAPDPDDPRLAALRALPGKAGELVARDLEEELGLRRPLTPDELAVLAKLQGCRYAPASWEKRFIRQLGERCSGPGAYTTSEKQRAALHQVAHRYRRQLAGKLTKTQRRRLGR